MPGNITWRSRRGDGSNLRSSCGGCVRLVRPRATRPKTRGGRMSGLYVCTGMQPGLQVRWFNHEDHEGHEEGNSEVNEPLFACHPPLCCFSERVGRRLPWTLEAAGISSQLFHGHDPPFVVFVLFVVNTNRRPMPPSRGRSLYKADMHPHAGRGEDFCFTPRNHGYNGAKPCERDEPAVRIGRRTTVHRFRVPCRRTSDPVGEI